jgi:hypothetical protein
MYGSRVRFLDLEPALHEGRHERRAISPVMGLNSSTPQAGSRKGDG